MPTPALAFAAVAAVLTNIDPADQAAVDRFFDEGLQRYDPRAQALIADFLIALTDAPQDEALHELKAMVARPAEELPSLDIPVRSARPRGLRSGITNRATPRTTDAHIGARVRQRRSALGMSEAQLAAALGLTELDIRRYEAGAAGLSAALLHDVSRALDQPAGFFFLDLPREAGSSPPPPARGFAEPVGGFSNRAAGRALGFSETQAEFDMRPPHSDSEHAEVLAAYDAIATPANRRRALALISGLAEAKS